MIIPLPFYIMNKKTLLPYKQKRISHHLKLKDLAFILGIDPANLSRFEAGKAPNSKALLGYHTLFDLSTQPNIKLGLDLGYKELADKCFKLLEKLEDAPDTFKNRKRSEGLDSIIARLTNLEE